MLERVPVLWVVTRLGGEVRERRGAGEQGSMERGVGECLLEWDDTQGWYEVKTHGGVAY